MALACHVCSPLPRLGKPLATITKLAIRLLTRRGVHQDILASPPGSPVQSRRARLLRSHRNRIFEACRIGTEGIARVGAALQGAPAPTPQHLPFVPHPLSVEFPHVW